LSHVGDPRQQNRYSYAGNSPCNLVDPRGTGVGDIAEACIDDSAEAGIAGAAGGAVVGAVTGAAAGGVGAGPGALAGAAAGFLGGAVSGCVQGAFDEADGK
jgi:hypothetical protein